MMIDVARGFITDECKCEKCGRLLGYYPDSPLDRNGERECHLCFTDRLADETIKIMREGAKQ